jgi:predicted amidophosphoribosyltransferase
MIENLKYIKENGIRQFLDREKERWKCPACGGTISCHNGICFNCGLELLKNKKKRYRWEDEQPGG